MAQSSISHVIRRQRRHDQAARAALSSEGTRGRVCVQEAHYPSVNFSGNEFNPKVSLEKGRMSSAITTERADVNVKWPKHLVHVQVNPTESTAPLPPH